MEFEKYLKNIYNYEPAKKCEYFMCSTVQEGDKIALFPILTYLTNGNYMGIIND